MHVINRYAQLNSFFFVTVTIFEWLNKFEIIYIKFFIVSIFQCKKNVGLKNGFWTKTIVTHDFGSNTIIMMIPFQQI